MDGTIDVVVSDHRPEDLEHHDVEFSLSSFGIASIESTFAVAHHALKGMSEGDSLNAVVRALSTGPRHVLGLEQPTIMPGQRAELTWFHRNNPGKTVQSQKEPTHYNSMKTTVLSWLETRLERCAE